MATSPSDDRRRELVRLMLARGAPPPRPGAAPTGPTRLSRGQRRLWFLERRHPGTAQNNIALAVELADPPARPRMAAALRRLQTVHEVLRLRLTGDDDPLQEPVDDPPVPLSWHDLTGLGPTRAGREADRIAAAEARRPIGLGEPPLYRATVVLLPAGRWRLVLVFHHIVVDGWSVDVLKRDLATLLAGGDVDPPATTFRQWVAEDDDTESPATVRRYWAARFADQPKAATVTVHESPARDTRPRGGLVPVPFGDPVSRRVRDLAARLGTTRYAVCLAAVLVLLRRMNDADPIVVGTPVAGRDDPRLDRVVGFFVRTVALRVDVSVDDRFDDLARRVAHALAEAVDHQPMPFDDLVALTGRSGAGTENQLFRTMFAWHSDQDGSPRDGAFAKATDLDTGTAKFDLTFLVTEDGPALTGAVEWSASGLDETAAHAAARAFTSILLAATGHPGLPAGRIPLWSPAPATPAPTGERAELSLADGLFRQATATPNAVAVVDEVEGAVTYADLGRRVARTAAAIRGAGLRPGERVPVLLERSVDLIVGVHAVTAAGCAYVPIDTTAPPARIEWLLNSADATLVLVHARTRWLLPDDDRWRALGVDVGTDPTPVELRTTPAPAAAPAYLLHTSGSTGEPKPVAFPTNASQVFLDWLQSAMPIGPGDRVLCKTPYGFDVSVWELFWPLQHGATVVLARPSGHVDPGYLARLVETEKITVINFVPSVLELFLDEPASQRCRSLRWILCAGEALHPALRDRVSTRYSATLVNLYGPTECGAVSAYFIDRDDRSPIVPIGRPLPHVRFHVLDQRLLPTPPGLPGELYVGGALGTAIGYWNQPGRTAGRFVPDQYADRPGQRLYRTGDRCRELPDGAFEYVGRLDRQVKVHGVRIEPAEIEAVLGRHPAVASARVLVLGEAERRELVAFCTTARDQHLDVEQLLGHAADLLPRQLVPGTIVELDRLPLSVNGKTDESALARIWRDGRRAEPARPATTPAGDTAEQVAAAFQDVLGRPVPDSRATFFELGGNSLLLLRLATAVRDRTGRPVDIVELAENPTIDMVTALLRDDRPVAGHVVPLAPAPGAPRLVLLPPAAGSALAYVPLSRALSPALSVYGLNAPGLRDRQIPPRTVAGFVEALLPDVEPLASDGPLVLGGWSFGGVLAYELGVVLEARGVAPSAIVLVDSWVPAGHTDDEPDALEFLRARGLVPDWFTDADLAAIRRVLDATATAFAAYRPAARTSVPVHLVRAAGGYPAARVDGYTQTRGWETAVDHLRISDVPGDHFELLAPPSVAAVADELRNIALATHSSIGSTREE